MTTPRVVVVGLGPAGPDLLAPSARRWLEGSSPVVLRTGVHPAAGAFPDAETFDHLYETAATFEEIYEAIVDSLAERAHRHGEIVYGVPGSAVVAERTVELLGQRHDLEVEIIPALSFADVAYAALGIDPMAAGIRMVDATAISSRLRGPGPILVVQCHSRRVLSDLKLSIDVEMITPRPTAVLLHHLGLPDEHIAEVAIDDLDRFEEADHLTSVYIASLRTVGPAAEDLVDLMARLRAECPWDMKQTHGSLTRHLLEEAYESLEALEKLAATLDDETTSDDDLAAAYAHSAEELGDLVFQVVFHAHLAAEAGRFDLTDVFDGVRTKLVHRHPHVFADVVAETADEVASNWEDIKKAEKGRSSVTEGIPVALPALARRVKLGRKATSLGMELDESATLVASARTILESLAVGGDSPADDAASAVVGDRVEAFGRLLAAVADLARIEGVDPEAALRRAGDELRDAIVAHEQESD
ncbi:MAG: MazG family protein [Actinomycetes bacterium]